MNNGQTRVAELRPIRRELLSGVTVRVARNLIGAILVRQHPLGVMTARIVETEAYPPGDPASHAFRGRTPRCGSMFSGPGRAYIYISYGTSFMLNISAEPEGIGAGVLIRAVEPLEGMELMRKLRPAPRLQDLTRGPGRLTQALGIDLALDGTDLTIKGPLWLAEPAARPPKLAKSVRIGITRNTEPLWRFFDPRSPWVSGPAGLNRPNGTSRLRAAATPH
jgi:DNA-3-methyladenine glycosylase